MSDLGEGDGDTLGIAQLVERFLASFAAGDRAAFEMLFEPDAVIEDPVPSRRAGRREIGDFFDAAAELGRVESRAKRIVVCDRSAAVDFVATVTSHTGDPSVITIEGIDVIDFSTTGRIERLRAFYRPPFEDTSI